MKLLEEIPAPLVSTGTHTSSDKAYLSAANIQKLDAASAPLSSSASLSEGKLSNILAYLDEMEKADQDLLSQLSRSRAEVKTNATTTKGNTPQTDQHVLTVAGRSEKYPE